MSRYGFHWRPYVPVYARRARAHRQMERLRKKGVDVQPVEIAGRKIARTFWGEAWCGHLEKFSDYENRLPRGRTYVRNGSVCHLDVKPGAVTAKVSGSEMYNVAIKIKELPKRKWRGVKERCAGRVGSLLELLQGRLSRRVMEVVTDRDRGLFPRPREIRLACDCPDWASMCKHVAAALYGVGARLDEKPELLFLLRGVDHNELIGAEADVAAVTAGRSGRRLAKADLSKVFGIDLDGAASTAERRRASAPGGRRRADGAAVARGRPAPRRRGAGGKAGKIAARAQARPPSSNGHAVTGKAVAGLRAKLGMPRGRFARLLGVSVPTVGNWEQARGGLNLQARTLRAWRAASRLSKREAWRRSARA